MKNFKFSRWEQHLALYRSSGRHIFSVFDLFYIRSMWELFFLPSTCLSVDLDLSICSFKLVAIRKDFIENPYTFYIQATTNVNQFLVPNSDLLHES